MEWVAALRSLTRRAGVPVASVDDRRVPAPDRPVLPVQPAPRVDPSLEELFAAAEQDYEHQRAVLVESRLRTLCHRRVPLRAVRSAPAPDAARLSFANGTVLVARARRRGDLLTLAVGLRTGSVCVESWSHQPEGTNVRFGWGSRRVELWVLGLDQAD